jgi:hypothetical protein
MNKILASALFALLYINPVYAQLPNLQGVSFTLSADHNLTVPINNIPTPAVASYDLMFYLTGTTAPFITYHLGKPSSNLPNNEVQIIDPSWFLLLTSGEWFARVSAIGPGGVGVSEASANFPRLTAPRPAGAPRIQPLP